MADDPPDVLALKMRYANAMAYLWHHPRLEDADLPLIVAELEAINREWMSMEANLL